MPSLMLCFRRSELMSKRNSIRTVIQCATLAQTVKVKLDNDDENSQRTLPVKEILLSKAENRKTVPSLQEDRKPLYLRRRESFPEYKRVGRQLRCEKRRSSASRE